MYDFFRHQGYFDVPNVLVPYRNVRYHLTEAGPCNAPETPAGKPTRNAAPTLFAFHLALSYLSAELFNLRHSSVRSTVERAFGILRMRSCPPLTLRFGILRRPIPGRIETARAVIHACVLLHNFLSPYTIETEERLAAQVLETQEEDLSYQVRNPPVNESAVSVKNGLAREMFESYVSYRLGN